MLVSVVIPTVDRRETLIHAARGALNQHIGVLESEIIVVDNSSAGSQRWIEFLGAGLSPDASATLRYVSEPKAGLAYARNRGVSEAQGEFVVFLDDDEEPASNNWLSGLIATAQAAQADVTFGAVTPRYEKQQSHNDDLFAARYSRQIRRREGADITDLVAILGTGNSCFHRRNCFGAETAPFNTEFNHTGGEDADLLRRLRSDGKRFAWAPAAEVYEYVPAERLSRGYLSNLRLRQGQQRVYMQIASGRRHYGGLLFWMTAGVLQTFYHGTALTFARLLRQKERAERHQIEIWGGIGKVFWQARFRREHYGAQGQPQTRAEPQVSRSIVS